MAKSPDGLPLNTVERRFELAQQAARKQRKEEEDFRLEKTERLRALRLAKEAEQAV